MIRVVIAEERTLIREALAGLLAGSDTLEIVGQTSTPDEAVELSRDGRTDVIVLGATADGGIGAVRAVQAAGLPVKVLVVGTCRSMNPSRVLAAGAAGYVGHEARAGELVNAIGRVHAGERIAPTDLGAPDPVSVLSPRELETLRFLAVGLTNREIATRLGISVKTIDTHRGHVLKKLGLRNNSDLTRFALEHGLVDYDVVPEERDGERAREAGHAMHAPRTPH